MASRAGFGKAEDGKPNDEEPVSNVKRVTTATDLQRHKLEKLMSNPEKDAFIPNRPKEKKLPPPPEFMRNNWGSSAGAGSGDFHVYRGVRRREYARQKFLDEKQAKEEANDEYHIKVEENKRLAEQRSAKKRAKRLKKKKNAKKGKIEKKESSESEEDESEEDTTEQKPEDEEKL